MGHLFPKSAITLVMATTLLSGCVSTHSTGDAPLHSRNWPICSLIGGALGAGIGAAGESAAIAGGAAAGAIAGGLICYAQDGDEDSDGVFDRRDRCKGTPAGTPVHHNGCPLVQEEPTPIAAEPAPPPAPRDEVIVLSDWGKVLFEFDKSNLTPAAVEILDSILPKLKADDVLGIMVSGHTDSVGTDRYNQGLSERRAASVVSYLVSQGVPADKVRSQGFGESQPVADNGTDEGRAQNRRVEIAIDR